MYEARFRHRTRHRPAKFCALAHAIQSNPARIASRGPVPLEMVLMNRPRIRSLLIFATAAVVLGALNFKDHPVVFGQVAAPNAGNGNDALAAQITDLKKQLADLQGQLGDAKSPRIIAAGTATVRLGPQQDNKTSVRIKLRADVVARLGGNFIVELTNRYPTGDSFFVAYWKPAVDGFDILLADPSLVGVQINPNRREPYYIDWIVVQK